MIRSTICKCHNDSYTKGFSYGEPVWQCTNCGAITSRRIRKHKDQSREDFNAKINKCYAIISKKEQFIQC